MSSGKWKSHLLSSGLPLEFAVARILASKRFAVEADYTYAREDAGILKDFSVDISAWGFPPVADPDELTAELRLLVECKYRHDGTRWLFTPDPNDPDFAVVQRRPISMWTEFTWRNLDRRPLNQLQETLGVALKGTEIRGDGVFDSELRHGALQLQYALPRLLSEAIDFNLTSHPEDNHPFLLLPILVTTAELWMATEDWGVEQVRAAEDLSDFADSLPYLVLHSYPGPDFVRHAHRELEGLKELTDHDSLDSLEKIAASEDVPEYQRPMATLDRIISGRGNTYSHFFSAFLVCSVGALPPLIDEICTTVEGMHIDGPGSE